MLKMIQLLTLFIVFSYSSAQAGLTCQHLFLETGKDVKIIKQISENVPSELNLKAKTYEATGNPKQISEEVSDLVLMMAHARTLIISDKEINEKGKLVLGLPIANGFFLELKYRSNSSQENKFVLDHINLLSPSGKQIDVSSNPIDVYDDRKLSKDRVNFEIGTYPDGFNITASIPTLIKGDVLKEILQLVPKLELLPKDIIREIAKESNLKELKSKANKAHMKYFIKRYSIRGVFKTLFKIVVYEPIKLAFTAAVIYIAANTTGVIGGHNTITELLMPSQTQSTQWVAKSINESIQSASLPANVKKQLQTLQSDLSSNNVADASQAKNAAAVDQNASKLQVSKDQYLWTTTMTDKETGKTATIIFISRDNKQGQISYAAIQVDPAKYKGLTNYIQSLGQFIAISSEDLK